MALQRKRIMSPNFSSRGGSRVSTIVLHTAEGATTIESLGNFFASSSSGVSSHTGIDDKAGIIGEYVDRPNKAWTQANANPWCVSVELCAFAKWSTAEWHNHPNMLNNCAAWIAEEAAHFGIPIVRLSASQAQGGGSGVCQHRDLGTMGGNHSDCGNGFPMDEVLAMAGGAAPAPTPPTPPGGPAPPLHVDYFGPAFGHNHTHSDVGVWQGRMRDRGWTIDVDSVYGPQSENVCRQYQSEKGLGVDGLVGPQTWSSAWTAPVT